MQLGEHIINIYMQDKDKPHCIKMTLFSYMIFLNTINTYLRYFIFDFLVIFLHHQKHIIMETFFVLKKHSMLFLEALAYFKVTYVQIEEIEIPIEDTLNDEARFRVKIVGKYVVQQIKDYIYLNS